MRNIKHLDQRFDIIRGIEYEEMNSSPCPLQSLEFLVVKDSRQKRKEIEKISITQASVAPHPQLRNLSNDCIRLQVSERLEFEVHLDI